MDNKSEIEFKNWLDRHSIPYWYIRQDIETFSSGLRKYFVKRPDFFILVERKLPQTLVCRGISTSSV